MRWKMHKQQDRGRNYIEIDREKESEMNVNKIAICWRDFVSYSSHC